jgi:hypothetical protein
MMTAGLVVLVAMAVADKVGRAVALIVGLATFMD